ncbi:MAG: hypothetical protein APF81_03615 [Desulfosporosinus sp. BRH_c37]|nr:MAG: hypothetical protein APF81_03615 [Desulfosporosinus sp. BRH_c37]
MTGGRIYQVQEILDHEGWNYERKDNDILLVASFRTKKWKMVISCEGERRVCCFSVFPWACSEDKLIGIWEALNELNLAQRIGCFMINTADRRVVYRCGIHILDEYTSYEYIKEVLLSSVALVNANWDKVYSVIYGAG